MDLEAIRRRHDARRRIREADMAYVAASGSRVAIDVGGDQLMADIDALLAEVERWREWAAFTRDYAHRTMPHAIGQAHLALMGVRSQMVQALHGEPRPVQ